MWREGRECISGEESMYNSGEREKKMREGGVY